MESVKILTLDALIEKTKELQGLGKVVVQSHGIYDLIHPGVINHLNSAREKADVLIVTVIKDSDVRRGPGRPIFPDKMRAENVASLSQVNYVAIVSDAIPLESVKRINPDYYAKGVAFKDRDRDVHDKIFHEEREFYFGKIDIIETEGFSFSSTQIINKFLDIYPTETKAFLENFGKQHSIEEIVSYLDQLKDLDVLLIGDGIIDEYHYCRDMSKSAKAQLVVNKYLSHEVFAGGVFAVANHLSSICSSVHMISVLGDEEPHGDFIQNNLKQNVKPVFFCREDSPTIRKKRYINQYLNQKLFEINFLNDTYIDEELESKIIKYLITEVPKYDLVLIADFGHGLITREIISTVREHSRFMAVNTQTNGANAGYNLVTRYSKPDFVCLDEPEVRLAAQEKSEDIEKVAKIIASAIDTECLITTLGKSGSIGIKNKNIVNRTPIFSTKVVDTVGAGDAFFAYAAPCHYIGMPLDMVSFIGNAVGALAVQIVCNRDSVKKREMLEFVDALLK